VLTSLRVGPASCERWQANPNLLVHNPNSGLIVPGDVVQSMVLAPQWSDARMLAIPNVPAAAFTVMQFAELSAAETLAEQYYRLTDATGFVDRAPEHGWHWRIIPLPSSNTSGSSSHAGHGGGGLDRPAAASPMGDDRADPDALPLSLAPRPGGRPLELIVVDGGSDDDTAAAATVFPASAEALVRTRTLLEVRLGGHPLTEQQLIAWGNIATWAVSDRPLSDAVLRRTETLVAELGATELVGRSEVLPAGLEPRIRRLAAALTAAALPSRSRWMYSTLAPTSGSRTTWASIPSVPGT
jgi:hypothetical protein